MGEANRDLKGDVIDNKGYESVNKGNRADSARTFTILFLCFGMVLWIGDWFWRFYWFRWHERIANRPVVVAVGPGVPKEQGFQRVILPAGRVGDLTMLTSSQRLRQRFGVPRPEAELTVDPQGFVSPVYDSTQRFDYVVVGDSYMAAAELLTNLPSEQISRRLGKPVLNRAFAGRGPFQPLMHWIEENWEKEPAPRWIIWGFAERDVAGGAFAGYVYLIERHRGMVEREWKIEGQRPLRIFWNELRPLALKKSLPDSSALAQLYRRLWARLQYDVFGLWPAELIELRPPGGEGRPMLGYAVALDAMYWPKEVRRLDQVADSIQIIAEYLGQKGIRLLVVPIPDKEQVYREWIPPRFWRNGNPPPPSIVPDLVELLQRKGIASVSLWEPFRRAVEEGWEIYWPDDTHWNSQGISIAADEIARALIRLENHAPGE